MPTSAEWLEVRAHLLEHRHALALAAASEYPDVPRVAGTPLLTSPDWMPAGPIPLADLSLELKASAALPDVPVPALPDGFGSYSETMAVLAAPAVFQNRGTYRLLGFTGRHLTFGLGSYFDGINVGEACAHEYAAQVGGLPLRSAVGDPCDPRRRPVNVAISTLTLRHDEVSGEATFFLHWRDPKRVGHAGGMFQVLPVGVFQGSSEADFSLWHCMIREFAEEMLGAEEIHDADYAAWPFARRLTEAARVFYLGMGVDPLTFATDMLTVAVIEASRFDELFGDLVSHNEEGQVLRGLPFTASNVERFVHHEPTQAAGAALLSLAWQHRAELLKA
ncbi:hypothetical protein SAMN04488074_107222 [Lentzea albidocapillata subsp. violacea]|uniref:Uncharacterized protein n=1 Tax=Lentzea albidocapillata subsp. violacea TaxID=128104 RepID=A0A1G9F0W2_9PSEU|nr:hypothetical protein [Lentzea albidocapillata]SDK82047.1 hypothetical protein SAMN04488074_107222 [Lentzea albidocapillata subsp. violacea]